MSLASASEWYRQNPFYRYCPSAPLAAFHAAGHPRSLIRKPNQVGGTTAGAWEAWTHLVGSRYAETLWARWARYGHPVDRDIEPSDGLVMVASMERTYPRVCQVLHETEPSHLLDPRTRYEKGLGYHTGGRRFIRTIAGHTMEFVSGEADALAVESVAVGWGWIDEPPKEHMFSGFLQRVAAAMGPVWVTLTPVGRPCGYLRKRAEGDPDTGTPPSEEWMQFRPTLTEEDCTTIVGQVYRSAESIAVQVAGMDEFERAQRQYGEWEGTTTGRRLVGFTSASILPMASMPDDFDFLRLGMDHGEADGRQYAGLWMVCSGKLYLLAEVVGAEGQTPREKAKAILDMLSRFGLTAYHLVGPPDGTGAAVFGDVNSAGLLGEGVSFNEHLTRAFASELGLSACPFPIRIPYKGKGSVGAGETSLSIAFREGRAFISDACPVFSKAARGYTGREEDLKHPIDTARYAIGDMLLAAPADRRKIVVL